MTHLDAMKESGLGLIAGRIEHYGDPETFWDKEMRLQPENSQWLATLDRWLGRLGHTGDLHQRLSDYFSTPVPRRVPSIETPQGASTVRIDPEGSITHRGEWTYYEDVLVDGEVTERRPANGLTFDADGVPLCRYRGGRRQDFSHMDVAYRMAQI